VIRTRSPSNDSTLDELDLVLAALLVEVFERGEAIGQAARSVVTSPDAWRERGAASDMLQQRKLLWPCVVRYGGSRRAA
jgi:hypothetical protein